MAIAFVREVTTHEEYDAVPVGQTVITVPVDVPQGRRLVLWFTQGGGSGVVVVSAADSRGNSWEKVTSPITYGIFSAYMATALQAGDTITVTHSSRSDRGAVVAEFHGLGVGTVGDGSGVTTWINQASGTTPTRTITSVPRLLVAFIQATWTTGDTPTFSAPTAGWETLTAVGPGGSLADPDSTAALAAYRIVEEAGDYSFGASFSRGVNGAGFIASILPDPDAGEFDPAAEEPEESNPGGVSTSATGDCSATGGTGSDGGESLLLSGGLGTGGGESVSGSGGTGTGGGESGMTSGAVSSAIEGCV